MKSYLLQVLIGNLKDNEMWYLTSIITPMITKNLKRIQCRQYCRFDNVPSVNVSIKKSVYDRNYIGHTPKKYWDWSHTLVKFRTEATNNDWWKCTSFLFLLFKHAWELTQIDLFFTLDQLSNFQIKLKHVYEYVFSMSRPFK